MISVRTLLLTTVVFLVVLITLSLPEPANAIKRCDMDAEEVHAIRMVRGTADFQAARSKKKIRVIKKGVSAVDALYELRVIFHVIMSSDGKEGYVPLDSIQGNIDSTNRVYSGQANSRGTGFDSRLRLALVGVTYTNNSDWFYNCGDYNFASKMKFATALSPATTINVWTCKSDNLLGWANYLPYELSQHSVWNGVNLNYKALPSSQTHKSYENYQDYADGDTFTHELGHALGLLHTFGDGRNGCAAGDNVDDTPAERTPAQGRDCQVQPPRKTCPDAPGFDPVWNIMDYVDDFCAEEFTQGQVDLIRYSIESYKQNLIAYEPLRCVADGMRGTARPMTVCRSQCFTDRNAPDGLSAPPAGWCRTDSVGNWAACCCSDDCFATKQQLRISPPAVLSCGRKQQREELLKPLAGKDRMCVTGNIGGDEQLFIAQCIRQEFVRWAFNYDGTIVNVGTGWCLTVLQFATADRIEGARVGLEPCQVMKPSQKWNVLSVLKPMGETLSLVAAPGYCMDTRAFDMQACSPGIVQQKWVRVKNTQCYLLRSRAACLNAVPTFGCSCRWLKGRCTN